MRELTCDEMQVVCGGSDESYAAGKAAGEAAGTAVMRGLKAVATISGVVALAIVLSPKTA